MRKFTKITHFENKYLQLKIIATYDESYCFNDFQTPSESCAPISLCFYRRNLLAAQECTERDSEKHK